MDNIIAIIDGMSRSALLDALGNPCVEDWHDTEYLRSAVRQQYETGAIDHSEIITADERDTE